MRVLVAGATGAIGCPLSSLLRAQGHHVTALVRAASRATGLDADAVVVADGLDPAAVKSAVSNARPDAVVHLMTALRQLASGAAEALEQTAKLRIEGTANLLAAARDSGARRIVAQSIAFATAPHGAPILDEDAPLYLDAPDPMWARTVRAVAELERMVLGDSHVAGVVLRYGTLYGPGTSYAHDGRMRHAVAHGQLPIPGAGSGVTSFLHVADAVRAAAVAVGADATGVFNVADDDPASATQWLPHYAARLGGPPPRAVPTRLATRLLGWFTTYQLTELRGVANDRARTTLGWRPSRPTWRDGLGEQ